MRIKYPHAFSLDRCQFPSGGAAAPLDHARFVAAAPQGYTYPAQPARVDFAVGAEGVGQAKAVVFFIIVVAIGLLQLKLTRDKEVQQ